MYIGLLHVLPRWLGLLHVLPRMPRIRSSLALCLSWLLGAGSRCTVHILFDHVMFDDLPPIPLTVTRSRCIASIDTVHHFCCILALECHSLSAQSSADLSWPVPLPFDMPCQ